MERVKLNEKPKQKNKVRLLMDSGAFGAWKRKTTLDVKKYGRYCLDNKHLIWKLVNLDQIPGEFRATQTNQQVIESAKVSNRNQQTLKDMGLRPIPVFHMGEPITFLEDMLRNDEGYIGLALQKSADVEMQRDWLNMVFNILTDKDGRPFVKTHGFACTSFHLMTHYPWRSVDSTAWALAAGYGEINVPPFERGHFNYLKNPTRVVMTGVAKANKQAKQKQFEGLGEHYQQTIRRYIEEVVGSTLQGQRYSSTERRKAMLTYYVELCKHIHDVLFKGDRARIAGPDHLDTTYGNEFIALKPWNSLIMAFATDALNKEWGHLMNERGADDRLLSYWNLKDRTDDVLEEFVTKGICGEYVRAKQKPDWSSDRYRTQRLLALHAHIQWSNEDEEDRFTEQVGDGRSRPGDKRHIAGDDTSLVYGE